MPKINVYLPDALASAVREAGVPVSAVCQAALSDAVEQASRIRMGITMLKDALAPPAALSRMQEGLARRMTPRLVAALAIAGDKVSADGRSRGFISSLDLLRGLLEDGENLAVRLLMAKDVDIDLLRELCATTTADELIAPGSEAVDTLFAQMSMPGRQACAAAFEIVVEFGHNYVGCEHLLIGLLTSDGAAAQLLGKQDVDIDALRQALGGAVAGVVHERRTAVTRQADTVAVLSRRIEAIERQLREKEGV